MPDGTTATFLFPAVGRKKISAAFDAGRLSSDGGVMLLAQAERRFGIAERLARFIPDQRDPTRIRHTVADMLRARIFAIACGYEDCNDFGLLRSDPAFKLACGHLPETGADLASQPTLSRLENAPSLRDAIRLSYALVDQWMASYATAPDGVVLDVDDTCDVVHGHQQLSLFNAYCDERCFLPIHVYDSATGRPVAIVLRPGKTPSGVEVRAHLRRLVRRIRTRWPTTQITAAATVTMPALRRWRPASRTASGISSAWLAPDRSQPRCRMSPMRCAPIGARGPRGGAGFRRDDAPAQELVDASAG